jgi:hypothetical protein
MEKVKVLIILVYIPSDINGLGNPYVDNSSFQQLPDSAITQQENVYSPPIGDSSIIMILYFTISDINTNNSHFIDSMVDGYMDIILI